MVSQGAPDDLCPACGVPVPRRRRGPRCPYCGQEFAAPADSPQVRGYLTNFGYGVCGAIIGGHLGLATALTDADVRIGDWRLTLFPLVGAIACATFAAGIGARLELRVRPAYEAVLGGGIVGALVVLCLALVGVTTVETLVAVGACTMLGAAVIIRRALARAAAGP